MNSVIIYGWHAPLVVKTSEEMYRREPRKVLPSMKFPSTHGCKRSTVGMQHIIVLLRSARTAYQPCHNIEDAISLTRPSIRSRMCIQQLSCKEANKRHAPALVSVPPCGSTAVDIALTVFHLESAGLGCHCLLGRPMGK